MISFNSWLRRKSSQTYQKVWLVVRVVGYSTLFVSVVALGPVSAEQPEQSDGQKGTPAQQQDKTKSDKTASDNPSDQKAPSGQKEGDGQLGWTSLLGKTGLDGWTITDFYRPGEVKREGDLLILEAGTPLTGITTQLKDFPTENFEIALEARRTHGNDFLCGLTFPVGKGFCSFIAGGWGGGLIGLSSIDGSDASENETTGFHEFKNGQWYKFRISVDDQLVRGWIDDKECFSQEREGHHFSTRIEVFACQPLGLCAFQSRVEVKNFRWRALAENGPSSRVDDRKP